MSAIQKILDVPAINVTASNDPLNIAVKNNPLTTDLRLRVSANEYGFDVVEGNITGHTPYSKIAFNPDVDAAEEDMWGVGGVYVFPTGAMGMEVVSSSNDDSGNSTGAFTVKIWYLDTSFNEKNETVTLKGTLAVPTVSTDIYRVNNFRVMSTGTGKVAAGNIDVRHLTDTPIYTRILAGFTRARNSIYTVPINKTLYIAQISYSVGASTVGHYCRFTLRATYDDLSVSLINFFYNYHEVGLTDAAYTQTLVFPLKFTTGTDIKVSVTGDAANANALCSCAYRGWLE